MEMSRVPFCSWMTLATVQTKFTLCLPLQANKTNNRSLIPLLKREALKKNEMSKARTIALLMTTKTVWVRSSPAVNDAHWFKQLPSFMTAMLVTWCSCPISKWPLIDAEVMMQGWCACGTSSVFRWQWWLQLRHTFGWCDYARVTCTLTIAVL